MPAILYRPSHFFLTKAFIVLLLLIGFTRGGISQDKVSPEYDEVKMTIEQSIAWAIEKDFDALYNLWDDSMFHFWLFSNSQVVGLDSFKVYSGQWKDPDFRGTRFLFKDLRIKFSQSGDVAWYSCYLDDCGSFKGTESCLENVFQTGVLEKKNGRWVHVLMHGSFPVDKIPENIIERFY
jgi:hypothetical protein